MVAARRNRNSQAPHSAVDRRAMNAEPRGCELSIPRCGVEDRHKSLSLDECRRLTRRLCPSRPLREYDGKGIVIQHISNEYESGLHDLLELTHVAGPRSRPQDMHR